MNRTAMIPNERALSPHELADGAQRPTAKRATGDWRPEAPARTFDQKRRMGEVHPWHRKGIMRLARGMALACLLVSSCSKSRSQASEARGIDTGHSATEPRSDEAQPDHRRRENHGGIDAKKDNDNAEHEEHEEHEEHGHGAAENSDLDRPVSELFAASCEHDIKTHACDECRYEVGVVKADGSLFDGGLLKTAPVGKHRVSAPISLTGEVSFDDRRVAHVSTLTEGIIKKVHITLGDKVKRGQALIQIESVAIGEAEADYLETQGLLRLAERSHQRMSTLHDQGISSDKEALIAEQEFEAAKIRNDAALGKLTRLGMNPQTARAITSTSARGRLVLHAPVDGTVLAMHAVAGEVAHSETSLITLGDNSSMWVWADLYDRNIALVTREQNKAPLSAGVSVKAFPGESFGGRVDFVSPSMSESSRTVKVRIAVPNPDGRLLAGMFAGVDLFIPAQQEVLAIPSKSILEDEGRTFVFIHFQGDYYVRRPITVGRAFAGLSEITEGLNGGDLVVTDGAFIMKSDVLRSKMGAGCAD